jgi:hypothetical protein
MGAFIILFYFLKKIIFIGPLIKKLEPWAFLNESPFLDPQLQNRNKCIPQHHTFLVYIHESWNLGKPYGIKLRCYWKSFKEQLGNLGNPKRTCWEHIENKEDKQKITPSTSPQKEKIRLITSTCWAFPLVTWNFYFQNCLLSFLGWANSRVKIWEHSYNIHLKVECTILCFTYVSRFYLVLLYLEMQTFIINCAMGTCCYHLSWLHWLQRCILGFCNFSFNVIGYLAIW